METPVAASIPMALHEALQEGRIQEGDIVLLVGSWWRSYLRSNANPMGKLHLT